MTKAQRDIRRKLRILTYAKEIGNISKACRHFGISREGFYKWKRAYAAYGEEGLINSKPCPENPSLRIPPEIEEKILYLRKTYHLGQLRISWFLERYHGIKVSSGGVYQVLKRNGMNRLPRNAKTRTVLTQRYEKQVPGHQIQVDVKFLNFMRADGKKIRRFQYTAVDDATRIRALKIYPQHTQENAIRFIDEVVSKFPFRIHTIRTDNGHEFQAKFHWHVEDLGMRHIYNRPRSPTLNGKVERSHATDDVEFYQLLTYTGDVDLLKKLSQWEEYYNFHRPHGALRGQAPYEVLREKLKSGTSLSTEV
jgi:transposase InsO family protein